MEQLAPNSRKDSVSLLRTVFFIRRAHMAASSDAFFLSYSNCVMAPASSIVFSCKIFALVVVRVLLCTGTLIIACCFVHSSSKQVDVSVLLEDKSKNIPSDGCQSSSTSSFTC